MPTPTIALEANVTILVGTLTRAPERRELPSGATVLGLEVQVRAGDRPAETVNVAWPDAPVAAEGWLLGEQVLVTGRTRRRFFRILGRTESRTEVVAAAVLPTRRAKAARTALEAVAGEVLALLEG